MRAAVRVLLIAALALLLAGHALAADNSFLGLEALEDGLPDGAREALDGQSVDESLDVSAALGRVLGMVRDNLREAFRGALGGAAAVLAAAAICSVAAPLAGKSAEGIDYVNLVGVFVILSASVGGVRTLIGEAAQCVRELHDFSTVMLPVLASASAASGAAMAGAAKYAASMLFLDILMALGEKLVLPMIYLYLAAGAGEAAFGGLAGPAKLLKSAVKYALTGLVLAFTVYLTATGLIASSADAAAVKLTKTAISTLLPVVGGMVSQASDAVASGLGVIRAAAGAFGVVAVLAVCALPFLRLAVGSVLFKIAAALASAVADRKLTGLIETVSGAYAMALGLAGTEAVILLVSIISGAKLSGL